jgi:transposase
VSRVVNAHLRGKIELAKIGERSEQNSQLYFVSLKCAMANLPFVIANPIHIKRFTGVIGQRAKTDKLDAQLIVHYGEAIEPKLSKLKPEIMQDMSNLVARRNQLLVMQTMEKNRLQILPKALAMTIKPILTVFKNQIEKIETKIVSLIEPCDDYQAKNTILQSMPDIGKIASASLISNLPELGYIPKPLQLAGFIST